MPRTESQKWPLRAIQFHSSGQSIVVRKPQSRCLSLAPGLVAFFCMGPMYPDAGNEIWKLARVMASFPSTSDGSYGEVLRRTSLEPQKTGQSCKRDCCPTYPAQSTRKRQSRTHLQESIFLPISPTGRFALTFCNSLGRRLRRWTLMTGRLAWLKILR